ncbi:MAG: tagaturonate epimerase family protein, partial [Actinobacteria bacterium]|nr:tagaturonate epimerase family protein [Actinomycetota bacterium]
DLGISKKLDGNSLGILKVNNKSLTVKESYRNNKNLNEIRKIFPHLSPSVCGLNKSFGTGDRLGLATPAHIRAFKNKRIFPFFVQQSVRELNKTNRSWQDVLDSVIWGCFEAGYKNYFGADADHLNNLDNLKEAIDCGYTMYTIDSTNFILNDVKKLTKSEIIKLYNLIPEKKEFEKLYLNKNFKILGETFKFDEEYFMRTILKFIKVIKHVEICYKFLRENKKSSFDFEVSLDEVNESITPLEHIFIVNELIRNNINFQNIAIRFEGEWQKAIDYMGDIEKFKKDISIQAKIAENYGNYKLSLHSGSDKFSIYKIFSQQTNDRFHIKTAGTSWLEAIRIIMRKDPDFYRDIHKFAIDNFFNESKYYKVSAKISEIPKINELLDHKLEFLLNDSNVRQLLHITYGVILSSKNRNDEYIFRNKIYKILFQNEEEHYDVVENNIEKHLELLGL